MDEITITLKEFEIAKKNGISRNNVRNRVENLFWDIERAITEPVNPRGRKTNLYCDHIRKLAKENKISTSTMYSRIQSGLSPYQAATAGNRKNSPEYLNKNKEYGIFVGGKLKFKGSVEEVAKQLNISLGFVMQLATEGHRRKKRSRYRYDYNITPLIYRMDCKELENA